MFCQFVTDFAGGPGVDLAFLAVKTGDEIANDIKTFVGPIAAVIIGVMGLRYVFGDQRSLAGFVGFLLLGIVVYVLIMYGQAILESLGGVFRSWVGG